MEDVIFSQLVTQVDNAFKIPVKPFIRSGKIIQGVFIDDTREIYCS